MSGIASILHSRGFSVQGTDRAASPMTQRLSESGIKVFIGHKPENLLNASVLVVSSAIQSDNPEFVEAKRRGMVIIKRAEMLAEIVRKTHNIAISGTHGKTTTSGLISVMLEKSGCDPTVVNGGIIENFQSNAKNGHGKWSVIEADESDASFLFLPATCVVITNIDPEHMEQYKSVDALHQAFYNFAYKTPFYGCIVCGIDSLPVRDLARKIENRRVVTYGYDSSADVQPCGVSFSSDGRGFFDVSCKIPWLEQDRLIKELELPISGRHNVQNALAAVCTGVCIGLSDDDIKMGLRAFQGVKRRYTLVGTWKNYDVVDDYSHHPVEIEAALSTARTRTTGKVIAIHQPHKYSRLEYLFDGFAKCFSDADTVLVSDVYSAGESPIDGVSGESLACAVSKAEHPSAAYLGDWLNLEDMLEKHTRDCDKGIIIFLGAGDITNRAASLCS